MSARRQHCTSWQRVHAAWLIALGVFLLAQLALRPTAVAVGHHGTVRFAVIGDSGTGGKYQRLVAQQMVAYHDRYGYSFVIMLGDNIYAFGSPGAYRDKFEVPYARLLERGVKFYATLGNHDVRFGHWKDAIKYPHFNMNDRRYYTFSKGEGLIQFFILDSTRLSGGRRDEAQLHWLADALQSSSARWKFVCFHHPIYSSGKRHGSDRKMRALLEPILVNGGAQVVFSGHDHFYERIAPQRGIYYFISGAAGKLRRGDIKPGSGLTVRGNDQVHHFMVVEINAFEMRFQAVSETGEVIDTGIIAAPVKDVEPVGASG